MVTLFGRFGPVEARKVTWLLPFWSRGKFFFWVVRSTCYSGGMKWLLCRRNSGVSPEKWWLEDDSFLLDFGNFSGARLNFGRVESFLAFDLGCVTSKEPVFFPSLKLIAGEPIQNKIGLSSNYPFSKWFLLLVSGAGNSEGWHLSSALLWNLRRKIVTINETQHFVSPGNKPSQFFFIHTPRKLT